MSLIDHFDIITGQPKYSRQLRIERWPAALLRVVNWFEGRLAKRRSRKHLLALQSHQLEDIGITQKQAFDEARRGFLD